VRNCGVYVPPVISHGPVTEHDIPLLLVDEAPAVSAADVDALYAAAQRLNDEWGAAYDGKYAEHPILMPLPEGVIERLDDGTDSSSSDSSSSDADSPTSSELAEMEADEDFGMDAQACPDWKIDPTAFQRAMKLKLFLRPVYEWPPSVALPLKPDGTVHWEEKRLKYHFLHAMLWCVTDEGVVRPASVLKRLLAKKVPIAQGQPEADVLAMLRLHYDAWLTHNEWVLRNLLSFGDRFWRKHPVEYAEHQLFMCVRIVKTATGDIPMPIEFDENAALTVTATDEELARRRASGKPLVINEEDDDLSLSREFDDRGKPLTLEQKQQQRKERYKRKIQRARRRAKGEKVPFRKEREAARMAEYANEPDEGLDADELAAALAADEEEEARETAAKTKKKATPKKRKAADDDDAAAAPKKKKAAAPKKKTKQDASESDDGESEDDATVPEDSPPPKRKKAAAPKKRKVADSEDEEDATIPDDDDDDDDDDDEIKLESDSSDKPAPKKKKKAPAAKKPATDVAVKEERDDDDE